MSIRDGKGRGRLFNLANNGITIAGFALTTVSGLMILTFLIVNLLGGLEENPYIGMFAFGLLPAFFVAGLLLMPAGMLLRQRRLARLGATAADLGKRVTQLRDLLAAEDSAEVADEGEHHGAVPPQVAEPQRMSLGVEHLDVPQRVGDAHALSPLTRARVSRRAPVRTDLDPIAAWPHLSRLRPRRHRRVTATDQGARTQRRRRTGA